MFVMTQRNCRNSISLMAITIGLASLMSLFSQPTQAAVNGRYLVSPNFVHQYNIIRVNVEDKDKRITQPKEQAKTDDQDANGQKNKDMQDQKEGKSDPAGSLDF